MRFAHERSSAQRWARAARAFANSGSCLFERNVLAKMQASSALFMLHSRCSTSVGVKVLLAPSALKENDENWTLSSCVKMLSQACAFAPTLNVSLTRSLKPAPQSRDASNPKGSKHQSKRAAAGVSRPLFSPACKLTMAWTEHL